MDKDKQPDDSWLVEMYKSGHQNALTLLVKRWHGKLCKQAYWYTKDYDTAKDIAQDSWKVVIDRIDSLKDSSRFGSWALSIVNNKSKDWLRKRSRSKSQIDIYYKEVRSNKNIYEVKEKSVSINIIKAISELPTNQQVILKLFYLESLTIVDISRLFKVSKGTVKSRLFYARERLKKVIKHRNYEK